MNTRRNKDIPTASTHRYIRYMYLEQKEYRFSKGISIWCIFFTHEKYTNNTEKCDTNHYHETPHHSAYLFESNKIRIIEREKIKLNMHTLHIFIPYFMGNHLHLPYHQAPFIYQHSISWVVVCQCGAFLIIT